MREPREAGEDLALAPVHHMFPVGQTWDSQPSDRGFWKFLHTGPLSVLPMPLLCISTGAFGGKGWDSLSKHL